MPKTVDRNKVRRVILSQEKTFTPEDIAEEAQISRATCYNIIKDMMPHEVKLDHKDGRRMYYGLASQTANGGTSKGHTSIMDLSPAERFEYVRDLTQMVAQGISPSALISGLSGIGKTYTVLEVLAGMGWEKGVDFEMVKGHSTPMSLYRTLFEHSTNVILYDDCDAIFEDRLACNILKAALDSYGERTVHWRSERLPDDLEKEFNFEGSIIAVTNKTAEELDEAIKSRTLVVDLQMSRPEICDYIETIFDTIGEGLSHDQISEILNGLRENIDQFEQFNIRTFLKACRIYKGAASLGKDWTRMIKAII